MRLTKSIKDTQHVLTVLALVAGIAGYVLVPGAGAAVIAYDVQIPLDHIGAHQPFKVGQVHTARIYYDDASLDQRSKRGPLLLLQHLNGVPAHPDEALMPMGNAFIDLSGPNIRFYYAAAPTGGPEPYTVLFDNKTERMTIRNLNTGELILSGHYHVLPRPITGPAIEAAVKPLPLIGLDLVQTDSYVATGQPLIFRAGMKDRVRLVYDPAKVDPKAHTVPLYGFFHLLGGHFAAAMPVGGALLDLGHQPYRLRFDAKVKHGALVDVQFGPDGTGRVIDVRSGKVVISGPYIIDSTPLPMTAATAPLTASEQCQQSPARGAPAGP